MQFSSDKILNEIVPNILKYMGERSPIRVCVCGGGVPFMS